MSIKRITPGRTYLWNQKRVRVIEVERCRRVLIMWGNGDKANVEASDFRKGAVSIDPCAQCNGRDGNHAAMCEYRHSGNGSELL